MHSEYTETPGRAVKHFPGKAYPPDTIPDKKKFPDGDPAAIRQTSCYKDGNRAEPDNNMFFLNRSNPLSSKGN